MKAYIFPGQGSQFSGMGKDLYEKYDLARQMFKRADEILGFNITELMFSGTADDLKQTAVKPNPDSLVLGRVVDGCANTH